MPVTERARIRHHRTVWSASCPQFALCGGAAMLDKNSNQHGPSTVVGNSNKGRPEASLATRDFAPMSIDELSRLYETVEAVLAKKIAAEIIALERCLQRLGRAANIAQRGSQIRQRPRTRGAGLIPRSCQSIAIQRDRHKHGPVAESNRSG